MAGVAGFMYLGYSKFHALFLWVVVCRYVGIFHDYCASHVIGVSLGSPLLFVVHSLAVDGEGIGRLRDDSTTIDRFLVQCLTI